LRWWSSRREDDHRHPSSRQRASSSSSSSPSSSSSSSRHKSSVPLLRPEYHSHEAYERSVLSATAFDNAHGLPDDASSSSSSSSWRARQRRATLLNPVVPHPRAPRRTIPRYSLAADANADADAMLPDFRTPAVRPDSYYPPYARSGRIGHRPSVPPDAVLLHDAESSSRMRGAARLARRLLDGVACRRAARPGRTTEEIDDALHRAALGAGGYPSPLNYAGFPKSVCASVNEVVCHGIPDSRALVAGDVASFDVSVYLDGVHGDNCASIVVGDYDDDGDDDDDDGDDDDDDAGEEGGRWSGEGGSGKRGGGKTMASVVRTKFDNDEMEERFVTARRLVMAALESRDEGVRACGPGACLSDIGAACHAVADAYG
jgi:methionine aminopeptidase